MKYLWLLLTVLFTLLIFANSALPMSQSGQISGLAAAALEHLDWLLVYIFPAGGVEHTIRKLAHFCEFALLCWMLCKTFYAFGVGARTAGGYILWLGLMIAVADEYIQLFADGRGSRVSDILLDFSGIFCMWLAWRIWHWSRI